MNLSPWLLDFINNYGILALFFTSFIAATIVPASSSAILLAALAAGAQPIPALIACSIGNSLGCAANYWIGRFIGRPLIPKLRKSKNGRKAIRYVRKYGTYSLFIAWAPFVGDPITIAAGIFRINFLKFSIIVYSFRIVGYIIVAAFFV